MRHILITGGSSGIGLHIAKKLATSPSNLSILSRSLKNLRNAKTTLDEVKHPDTRIHLITGDVSDQENLAKALSSIEVEVDVLIHSAGIGLAKEHSKTVEQDYKDIMNCNLQGAINITRAILPAMRQRNKGRIIYLSSVAALIGIYGYTAYSASKFALEGFLQSLRNELSGTGVYISAVYPPDVKTPMYEKENLTKPLITRKLSGGTLLTPEYVASYIIQKIPSKKYRLFPGWTTKLNCFFIICFPSIAFWYIDLIAKLNRSDDKSP